MLSFRIFSTFDKPISCLNIKGSFICCKYKSIKQLDFFEPIFHYPDLVEPFYDKELKEYRTKKEKGLGGMGNVTQNLLNYKLNISYIIHYFLINLTYTLPFH